MEFEEPEELNTQTNMDKIQQKNNTLSDGGKIREFLSRFKWKQEGTIK